MVGTEEGRAKEIEARIRAIQGHRDFPALSDQIREVVRVTQDDDADFDRLADLVIRNYGLTLKVLRTVNSVHYNRSGQTILSVTRAVLLLGVRTVRELAASFLLFDHYQRQSPELKQLMLLSMVTACHAERLAGLGRDAHPDEAYVCGMFRNLGEVLIAHHFPDDYARIQVDMRETGGVGADSAARLLGFRYEELGAAMARYWGMPLVGQSMLPMGTGTALRSATEIGHQLTALVYRGPTAATDEQIRRLLGRFQRELPVTPDLVSGLIQSAAAEVRKLFVGMGATRGDLELLGRGDPPATDEPPPAAPAPRGFDFATVREARDHLLAEVAAVANGPDFDLHRCLLILLEALQRGGPFDRALFCVVDADRDEVRARLSFGSETAELIESFRFPVGGQRNPIGAALLDREPVFVVAASAHPREQRIAKLLGAAAYGVLPLVVEGKAIGCLYCDRRTAAAPPDPASLIFLGRVQAIAQQAIERSRRERAVGAAS